VEQKQVIQMKKIISAYYFYSLCVQLSARKLLIPDVGRKKLNITEDHGLVFNCFWAIHVVLLRFFFPSTNTVISLNCRRIIRNNRYWSLWFFKRFTVLCYWFKEVEHLP
jgi:hypothetical protein